MSGCPSPEAEAWLRRPSWERPTELTLPVFEAIGPIWDHQHQRGGWFAQLVTKPNPTGEAVAECDHVHDSEEAAWTCARTLALDVVLQAEEAKHG